MQHYSGGERDEKTKLLEEYGELLLDRSMIIKEKKKERKLID